MKLNFPSGDLNDLKQKLSKIIPFELQWNEVNANAHQIKIENNKVSITYYSTTGTIQVQGTANLARSYEEQIAQCLNGSDMPVNQTSLNSTTVENIPVSEEKAEDLFTQDYRDSEIIIALVGAIGVQYKEVKEILKDRLEKNFAYEVEEIRVSKDIMEKLSNYTEPASTSQYDRITNLMDVGNRARESSKNSGILALGVAEEIRKRRKPTNARMAYIVNSIKHPEEVKLLREIYGQGFYLIGVFSDTNSRTRYLTSELRLTPDQAKSIIDKDGDDYIGSHGQHTSDTYHLSDFFIEADYNRLKVKESIFRFLDIIFGHPYKTPLFGEFAMFMAFTSSLRSADLSRQVGAVITSGKEIIATGANDIPKYGGGLYWPRFDGEGYSDFLHGRDYTRGEDSNIVERKKIIDEILHNAKDRNIDVDTLHEILVQSRLKDLIEFGRVVHAEMEALMMCARNGISPMKSVLYCTTFPCHNCAKHIVAAGVDRVVFIEPYPKSKALDFHSESIKLGFKPKENAEKAVYFQPFIGIGPRKFFDLFSLNLGSGRTIKRKKADGTTVDWNPQTANPKIQLFSINYIDREQKASLEFERISKSNDK